MTVKNNQADFYKEADNFHCVNNKKAMLLSIVNSSDIIGDTHVGSIEMHCEVGMGHTIGHALRRVLLSNFKGIAPVAVKIKVVKGKTTTYAKHQFETLPGIKESVIEVLANIRKIYVKEVSKINQEIEVSNMFVEDDKLDNLLLSMIGVTPGPLTVSATEIKSENLEIVNKNNYICSLDEGTYIYIDICFGKSYGACLAEGHKFKPYLPEGYIAIDSYFSPILSCAYHVEEITGETHAYDKLEMKISTNFSISPMEGLQIAAASIRNNIGVIAGNIDIEMAKADDNNGDHLLFEMKVQDYPFAIRTRNSLLYNGITTISDLVTRSPEDLLALSGFGEGCLTDVLKVLHEGGLDLNMKITGKKK